MLMVRLNRIIDEWVEKKLITSVQAENIIEYENSKVKKPWVLYAFIMLGVSILSIGIISIIASNWKDIPSFVKLAIDFLILSAIAYAAYRVYYLNKPSAFDGIAAFFMLFYLASIGLISQIYHTGGQLYQAFFLLCAVMLPVTLLTYRNFLPHLWTVIFLIAVIQFIVLHLDRHSKDSYSFIFAGLLFSLPVICAMIANLLPKFKISNKLTMPFLIWSIVFFFAALIFFDFNYSIQDRYYSSPFKNFDEMNISHYYYIINISCALFIASVFFNRIISMKIRIMTAVFGIIYCFTTNFFMIYNDYIYKYYKTHDYNYNEYFSFYKIIKTIGPVETIAALLLFSFIFSALNYKRIFSMMIILVGIRFLVIYFQVFGSLAYTGFGLIISGLIIIGLVYVWYKYNRKIEEKIGGLIK
jgi:uncharacterized membrane protein